MTDTNPIVDERFQLDYSPDTKEFIVVRSQGLVPVVECKCPTLTEAREHLAYLMRSAIAAHRL